MYKLNKDLQDFSYTKIENIENKNILIRASLDVEVDEEGKITEASRFYEALPLIKELAGKTRNLFIIGHLGRPKAIGGDEEIKRKESFWHVAQKLNEELPLDVELISDLSFDTLNRIKNNTDRNKIFLIENIRLFKGEESSNEQERINFAKDLASIADVYINDAFSAYRKSASTYEVAKLIPSFFGPSFIKEIINLHKLSNPKKPYVVILGGAKISEKLDTLSAMLTKANKIIIVGAMAYTLLKAKGVEVGKSLIEEEKIETLKELLNQYSDKLILPIDHIVQAELAKDSEIFSTDSQEIQNGFYGVDIGPKTINKIKDILASAKTILWNGPAGIYEWNQSSKGTKEIANRIVSNTKAFSLIGGGDTIAAINKFNIKGFSFISTGGGAMLHFLSSSSFPTLDVIVNKT